MIRRATEILRGKTQKAESAPVEKPAEKPVEPPKKKEAKPKSKRGK